MEKKTLFALGALIILGLVAFLAMRTPEKGERVGDRPRPVAEIKKDSIATLEIAQPGGADKVTITKKGDKWPNQFANGSQMGSLLKEGKRPDPSYTVLKYLAGPEGHLIRQRAMGAPPSIMNQKPLWDEWLKPPPQQIALYQKIMASGKIGPWSKIKAGGSEIGTLYSDELKKLLAGQSGPRQFADRMTEEGNRLLASGGK